MVRVEVGARFDLVCRGGVVAEGTGDRIGIGIRVEVEVEVVWIPTGTTLIVPF